MTAPDPGIDGRLDELAAAALAKALDGAREDAVRLLRARLTERLVATAEEQWAAGGASGLPPTQAAPAQPAPAQPAPAQPAPALDANPEAAPGPRGSVATPAGAPTRGWYVYGLVRARSAHGMEPPRGVAGSPVESLTVGDLAVVGSWMDTTAGWGTDGRGGPDLDALAPRVDEHQAVLDHLMARGPVVPFRFGRLYPDPTQLQQLLAEDSDAIGALLDRLEGRAEWGLTLRWAGPADGGRPGTGRHACPGDGSAYLARRGRELAAAGESADRARLGARTVHDRLVGVACDSVVRSAGRSGPADRRVALRASYLVADTDVEAFRRAAAAALTSVPPDLALTGDLTGPWPPYSFSALEPVGSPS